VKSWRGVHNGNELQGGVVSTIVPHDADKKRFEFGRKQVIFQMDVRPCVMTRIGLNRLRSEFCMQDKCRAHHVMRFAVLCNCFMQHNEAIVVLLNAKHCCNRDKPASGREDAQWNEPVHDDKCDSRVNVIGTHFQPCFEMPCVPSHIK